MPDYQVVLTSSGDAILEHHLSGGGGGGGGSGGSGLPGYGMGAYSIPIDGTTDAQAALTSLFATIPATGVGTQNIILAPGDVVYLATSLTIPSNIRVLYFGGKFKVGASAVLTLNTPPVADYQCFDESLGGHVVCGRPMRVEPLHWGAVGDASVDCSAARDAAYYAIAAAGLGGEVYWKAGTWRCDNAMESVGGHFGAQFGVITTRGVGAASIIKNGVKYTNVSGDWHGLLTFYGANSPPSAWIQKVQFIDIAFEGQASDGTDSVTPIIIDGANDMVLHNVWFKNFGIECVRGLSGTSVKNFTAINCHAYNTGVNRGAGVFNVGAQTTKIINCTFQFCSACMETGNSYTIVMGNSVEDCPWGFMDFSTWSGFNDVNLGNAAYYARGGKIIGNDFVRVGDRAILIPDNKGHPNPNYPTLSPANLGGNMGALTIADNFFDIVSICIWGGADWLGEVNVHDNQFRGQPGPTAGSTNCLAPTGGLWSVRGNWFRLGTGLQWASLVGAQYVGWNNEAGDRFVFEGNHIVDLCWNQASMVNIGSQGTFARNRFYNTDGLLYGTKVIYSLKDSNNGSVTVQQIAAQDFAYWDTEHVFSLLEPQIIPLNSDTTPPNMTFKPGDRLKSLNGASTWNGKRVTTGGTLGHTALSATGAATSGSPVLTMTSVAGLSPYEWVSVPTGGVAPKQIASINSGTGAVTMFTNFEATVAAGTAVSWATPTLVSW